MHYVCYHIVTVKYFLFMENQLLLSSWLNQSTNLRIRRSIMFSLIDVNSINKKKSLYFYNIFGENSDFINLKTHRYVLCTVHVHHLESMD